MGQRTPRSAHYNKGIWKKRNARYYDIEIPPRETARTIKAKFRKGRRAPLQFDWDRAPGHHCHDRCGCGRTGHFDENRKWVFDTPTK